MPPPKLIWQGTVDAVLDGRLRVAVVFPDWSGKGQHQLLLPVVHLTQITLADDPLPDDFVEAMDDGSFVHKVNPHSRARRLH